MTYNYLLDNFVSIPTDDDTRIFIYDKNGDFKYSIITDISHFFVKNNCVIIKMTNKNDISLSFESRAVAQQALDKLELIRKSLMTQSGDFIGTGHVTFNTLNFQMDANTTTADGDLATSISVLQAPKSRIKVILNAGGQVYAGFPDGLNIACYFTSPTDAGDPALARQNDGDVQQGDLLYWIGSVVGYQLDVTDRIDYEYLI